MPEPTREITWQDIRLVAGEGKLGTLDILAAVNVILKQRVADALRLAGKGGWRFDMENAPRDGTPILLLSKAHTDPADDFGGPYEHPARAAIGYWHPEGDSWCDEYGRFPDNPDFDEDTCALHITGTWHSGGGWFQPNEVTHFMPLPPPPDSDQDGQEKADG